MSLNQSQTQTHSTRSNILEPMVYYARPPVNSGGNMILSAEGPNFSSEQHSETLGYRHLYPWHGYGGYRGYGGYGGLGYPYGYGYGYGLGYGGIAPSCYRGMCGRGGLGPWYGASFL